MSVLKITNQEWKVAKLKLSRKYNNLTEEDLQFTEGQEDILIATLAKRLNRDKDYVLFTIAKQMQDLSSNRL